MSDITSEMKRINALCSRAEDEDFITYAAEVVDLRASLTTMQAREATLIRVLEDAVSAMRYIEKRYGRLEGVGWNRVFDAHDEALGASGLAKEPTC